MRFPEWDSDYHAGKNACQSIPEIAIMKRDGDRVLPQIGMLRIFLHPLRI
jgi:hypothetical protein